MFNVVLIEPEIPPNTGNIARLCVATDTPLHLIEPLGFSITDAEVRRAGLDYWDEVSISRHRDLRQLSDSLPQARLLYFSTKAERLLWDHKFEPDDCFVFGPETRGLPEEVLRSNWERCLTIPMFNPRVRSLNLANAVAITLYEALRQTRDIGS